MQMRGVTIELQEKAARFATLSVRWALLTFVFAVVLRFDHSNSLVWPSRLGWFAWLILWATKGIVDVTEDALDVDETTRQRIWWRVVPVAAVVANVCVIVVALDAISLWLSLAVMVFGSLLSGGIDRPVWRFSLISCAVGLIWGFLRLRFEFPTDEWKMIALGGAVYAVIDGALDRSESKFWLVRLKVLPLLAVSVVVALAGRETGRGIFLFAVLSPHFLIYDACKVLYCFVLLQIYEPVHVAGPTSRFLRSTLLRLAVYLGSRRSCEFATDPKVCARILAGSSDKGEGLERFVSLNAFDPIRATESVNGEEWRKQREAVQRVLEKISKRTDALEERVKQALCNVSDLTSMALHDALARVLHEWIFGSEPSDKVARLWVDASISFRGRIALKNRGDRGLQDRAMQECLALISASGELSDALDGLSDAVKLNVIAQPFIISPLINVSDALVGAARLLKDDVECKLLLKTMEGCKTLAMRSLLKYPPFPLFERVAVSDVGTIKAGTHVFVEIDEFASRGDLHEWMAFGLGARACPGRGPAMTLLASFLHYGFGRPNVTIRPEVGHKYSGRLLDGQDADSFYFAESVLKTLKTALNVYVQGN